MSMVHRDGDATVMRHLRALLGGVVIVTLVGFLHTMSGAANADAEGEIRAVSAQDAPRLPHPAASIPTNPGAPNVAVDAPRGSVLG